LAGTAFLAAARFEGELIPEPDKTVMSVGMKALLCERDGLD
jgi:hypothetical protein